MNIAVVGGTGFIGKHLVKFCLQSGHRVALFTRHPETGSPKHPLLTILPWPINMKKECQVKVDAVINLAGETINQRWTSSAKQAILESRINVTKQVIECMHNGAIETKVLLNGSAVGYYGHSEERLFTEQDQEDADDFLAAVTRQWENEADKVKGLGIRLVKARFGVVFGAEGGALQKMVMPYRMYAGGPIGKGNQWISWIHIEDALRLMIYCLENPRIEEVVNFTAPHPVTMDQLGRAIGAALNRPHWLPVPAFMFKAIFGEMSELLLKGQRVIPHKALEQGYSFLYPDIEKALKSIFSINEEEGDS